MLDGTGDKGAIERAVEHPAATRSAVVAGFQRQPHGREAAVKFREQRGQAHGSAVVSIEPIASGPFGFSPSSRAARTASRDSTAIRCA